MNIHGLIAELEKEQGDTQVYGKDLGSINKPQLLPIRADRLIPILLDIADQRKIRELSDIKLLKFVNPSKGLMIQIQFTLSGFCANDYLGWETEQIYTDVFRKIYGIK